MRKLDARFLDGPLSEMFLVDHVPQLKVKSWAKMSISSYFFCKTVEEKSLSRTKLQIWEKLCSREVGPGTLEDKFEKDNHFG